MKIYKVTFQNHSDSSQGFGFYSSKSAADKALAKFAKEEGDNFEDQISEVLEIEVKPTKKDIIATLNQHAAHCDNG